MSTQDLGRRPRARPKNGGAPAKRAVARWAWRLFRREWRQQFLIFALITVAVAATIVGAAVASDSPQPANFGFGTAQDAVSFPSYDAHAHRVIANLAHRFGRVETIANETESVPGTINTYELRAQSSRGPFSGPTLSLVSGHFPTYPDEVAVTSGVASDFQLRVGSRWRVEGVARRVVGIVENPQSLLEEFALLIPGQVPHATTVTALFDASGASLQSIGHHVETPATVAENNPLNPETISLTALVLGMMLIALVSVGGFTVLAQRRLRSIGMLESIGATDRHVRLAVRANGTVVGVLGALAGFVLGLVVWLAYRPKLEQSAHHVIGTFALPWFVVVSAIVLAVVATYFAASRPARSITRVPIVAALSGRPAPPRQVRRSAIPGIVCFVVAFVLLGYSGSSGNGSGGGASLSLLLGLVCLIPGLILLAPFFLTLAARLGRHAPFSARLALRDLARYRARSGSALAAISLGVLISVVVVLAAASRFGNVFDYAGPNLSSNQLALYPPPPDGSVLTGPHGQSVQHGDPSAATLEASATAIARGLNARLIRLTTPNAGFTGTHLGRSWSGNLYVATPALLRAFGISASQIDPNAEVLTSRPGLSKDSGLDLNYGSGGKQAPDTSAPCTAATTCLANPVVQELGALPSGTSAPNTLLTEHAMHEYHVTRSAGNWLIVGSQTFSAVQIRNAENAASASQMSIEARNDEPTSSAIINWATLFGIVIALGVLGMSVGLVRSETASDLWTLAATGASSYTRRTLTAVTTGALGFLGALLGVLGGYIGLVGWLRGNAQNGGIAALGNIPVMNLFLILIGMPLFAALVGWLVAGREPATMAHQVFE